MLKEREGVGRREEGWGVEPLSLHRQAKILERSVQRCAFNRDACDFAQYDPVCATKQLEPLESS